jgi:hypothetical protein
MADRWDDIEILQAIDRIQQQNDGRPLRQSGCDLMNEIAGVFAVEPHRMPVSCKNSSSPELPD